MLEEEYWLTGFDTDSYTEFSEVNFKKLLKASQKKKYLQKEKFYKYTKCIHGELYPVTVFVFSYLWQELPLEQPFGYISISDIAEWTNCSEDTINGLLEEFQSYGFIKKHPDGMFEVRYRVML